MKLASVYDADEYIHVALSAMRVRLEIKQEILEETDTVKRLKLFTRCLNDELEISKIEKKLATMVRQNVDKSQKEYFLREKIKVMQQELGEVNSKDDEVVKLKNKCNKLKCPPKVKERIKREISRYEAINSNSPELGIVREYLDWMLHLPWNNLTKDNDDLVKVKDILDSSHYALDDVKDRILEYLAVKQNTNSLRSPILCLVGPPGVGKSSIAKSVATAVNRKFARNNKPTVYA